MRASPAMVAFLCSGCSFAVVRPAPVNEEQLLAFDCTSSVAAPVLDLLLGSLTLAAGMSAASATDDRTWSGNESRGSTAATMFGMALASFFSAGYGFSQASKCRMAKDDLRAQLGEYAPTGAAWTGGTEDPFDLSAPLPGELSPQACAPLIPALASTGSEIHAGPDTQARVVTTLRKETAVCVELEREGFGLRRVKLKDGTTGFVVDSDLSKLDFRGVPPP